MSSRHSANVIILAGKDVKTEPVSILDMEDSETGTNVNVLAIEDEEEGIHAANTDKSRSRTAKRTQT